MKLLSIGNSFSQDAHRWLYDVCKSAGKEIYNVNLYFGGCSLYGHWNFYAQNKAEYDYEIKGEAIGKISLKEALAAEKWDIITYQQASNHSGMYEKYQPYLCDLHRAVRALCPDAKFYMHKTWAYENDFVSSNFENYNNDQREMYERLNDAYSKAAESIKAEIIPTGDVIQYLRENTKEFDYKNGGLSLNRDGFHLSYGYGRYAAALCWANKLFGIKADDVTFVPDICDDKNLVKTIKNAVDTVFKGE